MDCRNDLFRPRFGTRRLHGCVRARVLANAGVILSLGVFETHSRLMLAIILGLVVGKLVGIFVAARLAVRFRIAVKPAEYS